MKGVIFTSFMDMVDEKFGFEVTEKIVNEADLESGGAYSAVGTYDHMELIAMVVLLSKELGVPVPDLVKTFGEVLFTKLADSYPHFFENVNSAFEMLEVVDRYIHVEVKKLYPDALLPEFDTTRITDSQLEMIYRSPRCLGDVAEGLIKGCGNHFNQRIEVMREKLDSDGSSERFMLELKNAKAA